MSTGARVLLALFVALLATIGVQTWRLTSAERRVQALELAPERAALDSARAKVETVTVRLAARIDTVTRIINGALRTDTLVLAPQTPQDTATAVGQLPVLAAAYDTLRGSCSALAVTCGEYRATAERRFGADSTYIVSLEREVRRAQPSRLGAVLDKAKGPLAFAAGFYLGWRLVQ